MAGLVVTGFSAGAQEAPTPTPAPKVSPTPAPQPPPLSRRELVDSLPAEDVERAIAAIREAFLDTQVASDPELRRAALEGLLVRMGNGLALAPADTAVEPALPAIPFLSEILDSHVGYVRPGTVDNAALSQFDSTLTSFKEKDVAALVLDLRSVTGGDFETAAEFARRLVPRGKLLFTLQKPSAKQERIFTSNNEPVFEGLIVVLIDSRTAGAAEALAATLRANTGAMIVGSDSAGAALEFEEVTLGKARLRMAVSQILLPQGGSLFPDGIKPDIAVSLPPDVQWTIFRESTEKGVSGFVFESERRRMNEASLVANTNPEIDSLQSLQGNRRNPPPMDVVLQRAVDLVTAIQFYSKGQNSRGDG